MAILRLKPKVQHVTVVVDETNINEVIELLEQASDAAVKRVNLAVSKLDAKIAEAKSERGQLESAVGTARRKGRSW